MTPRTGPDCAVMYNLINMHTYVHIYMHIYIHTYIHIYIHTYIYTYIHTYIHTYRSVAKMGTGMKGTGTRVGSGMAKKRLRSARNR